MKKKSKFTDKVDYTKSIAFKVYIFILLFGFMLVSSIYIVFSTFNKHEIQEGAYGTTVITAKKINAQLETKLMRMQTLATSLANLGTTMGSNHQENKRVLKKLLDMKGYERFIAGGGIWPEPFVLDSTKERSSYFYARNKNGGLDFYNDYNEPKGSGYHHEEWYVPAKFYEEGKAYYSKSYVDPYSSQPMVTITVPMYKNKKFIGVSTVDVMLDGLQNFLKNNIEELGGYGFIVDRNNKFLSYPDDGKAKFNNNYITLDKLVETTPSFTKLNNTITAYSHLKLGAKCIQMAKYLDKQSEQIDEEESKRISLLIRDSNNKVQLSDEHITMLSIKNDPILKEDSIVISIYKPNTHWNLVIAIPSKSILTQSNRIFSNLILVITILVFISAIFLYFIMKTLIIKPIRSMIEQLNTNNIIVTNGDDEFALLAFWFNKKTDELQEKSTILEITNEELDTSHEELSKMNKGLEEQVYKRTQELDIQTKKAQDSTRLKSQFLANMSHEIRTPMNGIIGMNHLLLKTNIDQEQKGYIQKVDTSANILLRIINDILDISKIESGKLILDKIDFSMNDVLLYVENSMNIKANEKQLNFNIYHDDKNHILYGDSLRISQILINLIGNAVKFTHIGKVELTVEYLYNNRVKFIVSDTGIGLTQEQIDKLFESFSQADATITRKYGGSGLGLTITKELVELMGGSIQIQSELHKGSKFIFDIELPKGDERNIIQLTKQDDIDNLYKNIAKLDGSNILLVEDNKINQEIIVNLLKNSGINIDIADDGEIAVNKYNINKNKYELILMDLQMPIMDGLTATKIIRDTKDGQNIPIIALTANAMQEDIEATKDAGMNEHLTKPIDVEKLYTILLKYISLKNDNIIIEDMPIDNITLPNFKYIDTSVGLLLLLDNQELYIKLLNDFYNDYKDIDFSAFDDEEYFRLIHSISGVSGSIGATQLHNSAKQLDSTQDKVYFDEFKSKLNLVIEELKEKLKINTSIVKNNNLLELNSKKRDELFSELKTALRTNRPKNCTSILQEIEKYKLNKEDSELFVNINRFIDNYQLNKALELL